MLESVLSKFEKHIDFNYSCFDRVVLRGYLPNLFVEGSVIKLLRNLGFTKHKNGVYATSNRIRQSTFVRSVQARYVRNHLWNAPSVGLCW